MKSLSKKTETFIVVVIVIILAAYLLAFLNLTEDAAITCKANGWDYGAVDWRLKQYCAMVNPDGPDQVIPIGKAIE